MSKSSLPRELLSAYFDGEVSAEERAVVSRAVEKSPAAQQRLEDYAQLSESLQALKQGVSPPDLRSGVLSKIQSPQKAARSPISRWVHRRRLHVVGGALAATAACLLLIFWPAQPAGDKRAEFAMEASDADAPRPDIALAHNDASTGLDVSDGVVPGPGPSPSAEESAERETPAEPSSPGIELAADDRDLLREALITEEWLTQQSAAAHRIPQPGDVMDYILREAGETVVIPVTVVDVQMTAGEIRVLLQRHGIQALASDDEPPNAAPATDSSVAILVESNWERVKEVMEVLDTQGFEVTKAVESSPTAKLAMMAQNRPLLTGAEHDSALRLRSISRAPAAGSLPGRTALPEGAAELQKNAEDAPLRMFHAQLAALVSDEFVQELEQKQQALLADEESAHEEGTSALADVPEIDPQPRAQDSAAGEDVALPKSVDILATRQPARVLFLIQKSGRGR